MKPLTRFSAILAMAFVVAFLCGCRQSNHPKVNGPANGTNRPAATPETQFRQRPKITEVRTRMTFENPDGSIYEGEVDANSAPDGEGHIISPAGRDQHGEFRHGTPYKLTGTWVAGDGTKEVGTWYRDGTTCGGTIFYTNGWKYVGDWRVAMDGTSELPDGAGVMTSPDGKVQDGLWKRGSFVGPKP